MLSRVRASLLPILLLLVSCAAAGGRAADPAGATDEPVVIADAAAARAALGRRVQLEGTARNAKLSAVVVRGDLLVYLLDRDSWPDERDGATVTVRGVLEETNEFMATRGPDGAISTGTDGPVFVLRRSEVEPPAP